MWKGLEDLHGDVVRNRIRRAGFTLVVCALMMGGTARAEDTTPNGPEDLPQEAPVEESDADQTDTDEKAAEVKPSDAEIVAGLTKRTGRAELIKGQVSLNVPEEEYYYFDPKDAETVMVDLWGNSSGKRGFLVCPREMEPHDDDAWCAEVTAYPDGYVPLDRFNYVDWQVVLEAVQASQAERNKERVEKGQTTIKTEAWLRDPVFDQATHSIVWADGLLFGQDQQITNLNIERFYRGGSIRIQIIGSGWSLDPFLPHVRPLVNSIEIEDGHSYTDFDPLSDKIAGYDVVEAVSFTKVPSAYRTRAPLNTFGTSANMLYVAFIALLLGAFLGRMSSRIGRKSEQRP